MPKEGLQGIVNSPSKTFLAFCFCFIAGASLASAAGSLGGGRGGTQKGVYLYAVLFGLVFFAIIFWRKKFTKLLILLLFFFILGLWRFVVSIPDCDESSALCHYNGQKIIFIGRVSEEPDARISEARYVVSAGQVCGDAACDVFLPVAGQTLVKTRLYPEYNYNDTIKIECRLQAPENKDDSVFRYDKYLAKEGIWSVCANPKILKNGAADPFLKEGRGAVWLGRQALGKILWLKFKVRGQIDKLWPEPEASFMAGLLYGSKSGLPPELTDSFNKTGLTHIIAVSGFNITIIAATLLSVFIFCGLWRRQAFWVVLATLLLFVIFTGATASVVRAAAMGSLALIAQQIGRLSRMFNVLMLTAAVMVAVNPYILLWDAGFQLSFLATIGLVYLSPILAGAIPEGVYQYAPAAIVETLTQTLSAIIATLPLILYQFGRLSIVAPLVNVLVLFTIPWLMLFGFLAVVFSFIFYPLGQIISWAAIAGLKYVILVVDFFGRQSWSAVEIGLPWWGMAAMYAGLFFITYKIKTRLQFTVKKKVMS